MGIKSTKPLPKDFYEKILECEMNLKEKFDMQILGSLIKYLQPQSILEVQEMKKNVQNTENLNLLFKKIEVKKYMDEGKNIESNTNK